ncbi:MAG: single-stranded-DNA-specific exonuclease RecJ [Desulfobacterales bacterium]|nr:single-stranded-DNA-specific exonuclease RecJ [Desulfobacterales bacterium]
MKKKIEILKPNPEIVNKISQLLNYSEITATILANRNITSKKNIFRFLNPSLKDIRPPLEIKDIDKAVFRIIQAIQNKEKILIHGDYDVDGITGTSALIEFLGYIGGNLLYYIPERINEGYGFQDFHVSSFAIPNEVNLIITVDCGSDSHKAVDVAKNAGIDVIITDHHEISENLPSAWAVINPKRKDCASGLTDLAGVGVVFYLILSLRKHLREINFWEDKIEPNLKNICDIVALGTIADVVPLINENRIIANAGIDVIKKGNNRPGIEALLENCKIKSSFIRSDDIAFKIAPRLNAAGRMDHAKNAVELLTTKCSKTAKKISLFLENLNSERKSVEKEISNEIVDYLEKNEQLLEKKTIVLANPKWHLGVLGIVASRLCDKYYKPAVLIAMQNGIGKGSARSIPGIDLYAALSECGTYLKKFGGHQAAAGLSIKSEMLSKFQLSFEEAVSKVSDDEKFIPKLVVDYELNFDSISENLLNEIETMQPFGESNPEPIFLSRNVEVKFSKIVGSYHRKMVLYQPETKNQKSIKAVQFNINPNENLKTRYDEIFFKLTWNIWNGEKNIEIIVI